jgi:hypothetical protein
MAAKEQLLREAPGWSEHDAEVALRAVQRERARGGTEKWDIHDAAFGETMQGARRGGAHGWA